MAAMAWHNEPPTWYDDDGVIIATAAPRTDFWRVTHYGFIRDSGHFYYRRARGDFRAEVKVSAAYRDLYDQAGLMARVDETTWLKCGVEFVDGAQQASAVITRDYSDWSVAPLPDNPAAIWLRLTRRGPAVEVHYSLDGARYTLLRLAYLSPAAEWQVGPMCASPEGDGVTATFEGFSVQAH